MIQTNVLNAAEGKVGGRAAEYLLGYADTAYALDQQGMVVDLNDYRPKAKKRVHRRLFHRGRL